MKHWLFIPILFLGSVAFAQDPCVDLNVISVQYSPFTDTIIVVEVENNSSELFDYPGFVLIDANGDTLAKETVNYFGIGGQSVHTLNVRPNVQTPLDNFNGVMQLFTGFFDEFACQWDLNQSLCADAPCDSLIIGLDNFGGALVVGDFEWTVRDASNIVVETGQFTMVANVQYWRYGLCLEPGEYTYSLEALTEPSGGGPVISASSGSYFGMPSISTYLDWFNDPISTLDVPFFPFCVGSPNALEELEMDDLVVFYDGIALVVKTNSHIHGIGVFNTLGQQVFYSDDVNPSSISVQLPTGIYAIVLETEAGCTSRKVFLP